MVNLVKMEVSPLAVKAVEVVEAALAVDLSQLEATQSKTVNYLHNKAKHQRLQSRRPLLNQALLPQELEAV